MCKLTDWLVKHAYAVAVDFFNFTMQQKHNACIMTITP